MKIALIHDHLNQVGGAEKVLLSFKNIFSDSPIYTLLHYPEDTSNLFHKFEVRESFIKSLPFSKKFFRWYLPFMPTAIESFDLNEYDVILSDASAFAKGIISSPKAKHICYCHTPTRYLWNDRHAYVNSLKHGEMFKRALMLVLNRLRSWDYQAAQRVDHFIANSQFVAERIEKYYGKSAEVIYPPVDIDKFEISNQIGDYYLMIARLRPYKKVDLVIKAFNRSHCRALVHPQEEDFGITAVEAMASGRPVIAYRGGGALETIVENQTGVFFDEQTWEDLANEVIGFDHTKFNSDKIKEHSQKFSKERFQREILEFVKKSTLPLDKNKKVC